jgi:hypothetical protein
MGRVYVQIWNTNGDLLTAFEESAPAGPHSVAFSIRDFAVGVYLYRVNYFYPDGSGDKTPLQRFVVVK